MYCIPKIILIFCTIKLTKAVSLRIDGLIDLGPNWSYEYRILNPKRKSIESLTPKDKFSLRSDHQEDERMRRDEERLRETEERLRKEAAELRKTGRKIATEDQGGSTNKHHQHQGDDKQKHHQHQSDDKHKHHHARHVAQSNEHEEKQNKNKDDGSNVHGKHAPTYSGPRATKQEPDTVKEVKKLKESGDEERERTESEEAYSAVTDKHVTFSSQSDESSSSFSNEEKPKKNTMIDTFDLTSTRKPKSHSSKKNKRKKKVSSEVANEETVSLIDKPDSRSDNASIKSLLSNNTIKIDLLKAMKVVSLALLNNTVPVTNATTTTTTTTTELTTLRTGEIYVDPHKVKDDAKIVEFTNHLYKQTLKVFDVVKEKTSQHQLKKQIDQLEKNYEDKFKEFLRDSSDQKIKTRLGTQKVILNTIEMSNRILKRLVNYMIGDMDKKGVLRHNVATANMFQKEIDNEQNLELGHACKKFGICRSGTGFPEFLADILTILLKSDDKKFKQSVDALTEVVKGTDYSRILERRTERKLKEAIDKIEMQNIYTLRPMFLIIKNIITNKNKPLVVDNVSASHRVNATVALLEIIDLLDQKMPRNESNVLEWADIKNSFGDYTANQRYDVMEIMESIMKHLKKTLKGLDYESQKIVSKNLNIILT